ncbi:MAG: hypothetical protein KDK70_18140 [Myxococcales bacterium]|nr:hypothetical protein [Myxococcales bacterium]
MVPGLGTLLLDVEGYVARLLANGEVGGPDPVGAALHAVVRPDLGGPRDDGRWVELSCGARVRLGDCPWSDRVRAAEESLLEEGRADASDPVRVAERVLEHVMTLSETPMTLTDLSASSVVQLATAVLDRHERAEALGPLDDYDELSLDDYEAEQVRMVLALHRSLGRTRLPPPHSPPRGERPKPRWPPQSLPPQAPLLIAPHRGLAETSPTLVSRAARPAAVATDG